MRCCTASTPTLTSNSAVRPTTAAQRYFMSLIDSSLEGGFFVTDGGDERRLAYISEGMLHFLGYERDVFQGLMAGGLEAIVCSDDVALFRTAWREAVNGLL